MFTNDEKKVNYESYHWINSYSPLTLYLAVRNAIKITKSNDDFYKRKEAVCKCPFMDAASFHKEIVNVTSNHSLRDSYHCIATISKILNCMYDNYDDFDIGRYVAIILASNGELLLQLDNIGAILSMNVLYLDIGDIRDEAIRIIASENKKKKNSKSNSKTKETKTSSVILSKPLVLAVVVSAIFFIVSIFPKDV